MLPAGKLPAGMLNDMSVYPFCTTIVTPVEPMRGSTPTPRKWRRHGQA
jgi:hypothetical protein